MKDRLDTFVHALEHYCLMDKPIDLLLAIQYAKSELELADEREADINANALDAINDNYGG